MKNKQSIKRYFATERGKLKDVNRVEVIDHTKSIEDGGGRAYVKWAEGIQVSMDFQDEGRTLKIFIEELQQECDHYCHGKEVGVDIQGMPFCIHCQPQDKECKHGRIFSIDTNPPQLTCQDCGKNLSEEQSQDTWDAFEWYGSLFDTDRDLYGKIKGLLSKQQEEAEVERINTAKRQIRFEREHFLEIVDELQHRDEYDTFVVFSDDIVEKLKES